MENKQLYLAIDQGGGSTRAIVFDARARIIVQASQSIDVEHPRLGWVEQDADAILLSAKRVINQIADQMGSEFSRVTAAGLATQRSNIVCWRKSSGEPLSPAISWQDRRAYRWMEGFNSSRDLVRQKTGLVVSPHYGVSKLKWCLENIDVVIAADKDHDLACGPLASFLIFRLLKNPRNLIDPANASRTLLWNIHDGNWDSDLLALFGLKNEYLPECVPTYNTYGEIVVNDHSVPLRVVTGDQSAALYAYGNPEQECAYINMGTGVFIQYPTENQIIDIPGLLCSMVYRDTDRSEYVIESTINGASNALMEVEDVLGISGKEAEKNLPRWFEEYSDPPLFLNGVAGLAAPYWVPDFASRFVGNGRPEEKILAVAESILFLIKVNVRLLQENVKQVAAVRVSGGLSNADCLCQKLANLLEIPVIRSKQTEATAMGLAYLTANAPQTWLSSTNEKSFTVQQDKMLQKRFKEWEAAMDTALKSYA